MVPCHQHKWDNAGELQLDLEAPKSVQRPADTLCIRQVCGLTGEKEAVGRDRDKSATARATRMTRRQERYARKNTKEQKPSHCSGHTAAMKARLPPSTHQPPAPCTLQDMVGKVLVSQADRCQGGGGSALCKAIVVVNSCCGEKAKAFRKPNLRRTKNARNACPPPCAIPLNFWRRFEKFYRGKLFW